MFTLRYITQIVNVNNLLESLLGQWASRLEKEGEQEWWGEVRNEWTRGIYVRGNEEWMHWGKLGVQYLARRYHKKSPRFRLVDKLLYFLRLSRLWLRVLGWWSLFLGVKAKPWLWKASYCLKRKTNKKTFHAQTEKPVSKGLQFRHVLM